MAAFLGVFSVIGLWPSRSHRLCLLGDRPDKVRQLTRDRRSDYRRHLSCPGEPAIPSAQAFFGSVAIPGPRSAWRSLHRQQTPDRTAKSAGGGAATLTERRPETTSWVVQRRVAAQDGPRRPAGWSKEG